jgi:chemotaxis protein MotB
MSAGKGRRKRGEHHEEHPDERWLVTFADMMTLLVAVFMVLFAMSSVNISKVEALAKSVADAFSPTLISGGKAIKETGGQQSTQSLQAFPPSASLRDAMRPAKDTKAAAKAEDDELKRLQQQIQAYAATHGLQGKVTARLDADGLTVRLLTDGLLFDSGSADLQPGAAPVLDKLGSLLRTDSEHAIIVEGHTDSVPEDGRYPSNWELSTARASAVVRAFARRQVAPARMEASGRASLDPIATNATPTGRSKNRRVEILVPRRHLAPGTESTS